MSVTGSWLRRCGGADDPRVRLICLPWAGGAASAFRSWQLPAELGAEIWAVQWPGHETRWREPPARSLPELVEPLSRAVAPLLDRPMALLGHSMGALAAFELTRTLERRGTGPDLLVVSAHRAPHLPPSRPPAADLPLPALLGRLEGMTGTSRSVVRDTGLLLALESVFRADFRVCERYSFAEGAPLRVPVLAMGAVDDPEVGADELVAWSELASRPTPVHLFTGGHLFLLDHAASVLELVARAVADRLGSALPDGGPR